MNTIDWNKIKTSFEDIKLEDKMLIIPMVYADAFYFKLKSEAMKNAIPIEWIKKYLSRLEIISKDNIELGEEGYYNEVITIEKLLSNWEKENADTN